VGAQWWPPRGKAHVPDEQAADDRVLGATHRSAPVVTDAGPHLLHVASPVGLAEEFPCLGDLQPRRVAEEPPADDLVVRVVGLEEERLTRGQHTELTATAGLPEVHFRQLRLGRQEPIPRGIGNAHIRAHERYCAPASAVMPVNPAPAGKIHRSVSAKIGPDSSRHGCE
jgi:hypothetical protein